MYFHTRYFLHKNTSLVNLGPLVLAKSVSYKSFDQKMGDYRIKSHIGIGGRINIPTH